MLNSQKTIVERLLRTALGLAVLATVWRVWLGPITLVPSAQAQIPNAGEQRIELVREVRESNALLRKILNTLRNETLKVDLGGTDKKSTSGQARRGRKGRP